MKNEPVTKDSYIIASSGTVDERHRIVKHANTFAVFDVHGDICRRGSDPQGLYCQGTRFLSHYALTLEEKKLLLLSSDVTKDNHLVVVDLTNPDLLLDEEIFIPRGNIHVFRSKFLWEGCCYGKYRVKNYGLHPVSFNLEFAFGADFIDIFEVRGAKRSSRGKEQFPYFTERMLQFSYQGLDGIPRRTRIDFSLPPDRIDANGALYTLSLNMNQEIEFEVTISCLGENSKDRPMVSYIKAYLDSSAFLRAAGERECSVYTSNEHFNSLIERSASDLRMLLTNEGGNLYPYAGIPWYATPFGRDGLITAFETLWIKPDISKGVLSYLAEEQSSSFSDDQDAEPGKILHEVRVGEMANCGELPFSKYYGSSDATPLFVMLAGKYLRRTGDRSFILKLWPHIERALTWMNEYGDLDKDGFVEYRKRSEKGLDNQGWKDSWDAVFHADGSLAEPPIALCEIQGYVYAAKKEAAFIAQSIGRHESRELETQAEEIRKRFEAHFWDEELGGYILALDGKKKPCRIKGSNMGHCLFAAIASAERACKTAELLMSDDFFGGWGIRTLSKGQARYNPMSYHNGSIWPHDNAIIAEGFSNYGLNHRAAAIMDVLFHVGQFIDLNSFPELFCGFDQREQQGPTLYPVACSPQAWAAASLFLLLKACLGLSIDAFEKTISFKNPYLPEWLEYVRISNLEVNGKSVDFIAKQHKKDVSIEVLERPDDIRILIEKGVTV